MGKGDKVKKDVKGQKKGIKERQAAKKAKKALKA